MYIFGMKTLLALLGLAVLGGTARAESFQVTMTAVKDGVSYSHSQTDVTGETNNYVGEARASKGGAPRIIFNSLLRRDDGGALTLDYMFELAGEVKSSPPYQSVASLHLAPGGKVLAAAAGGYKYYLRLSGGDKPAEAAGPNYRISAVLGCGGRKFPAEIAAAPGTQCNVIVNRSSEKGYSRYLLNLLPGKPGADGGFALQYQAEMRPAGGAALSGQGETTLKPGGPARTVKAGGCSLRLKAEIF